MKIVMLKEKERCKSFISETVSRSVNEHLEPIRAHLE